MTSSVSPMPVDDHGYSQYPLRPAKLSSETAIQAPSGRHVADRYGNVAAVSAALIRRFQMVRFQRRALLALLLAIGLASPGLAQAQSTHTSKRFSGSKVNDGTVTHVKENGVNILKLSA